MKTVLTPHITEKSYRHISDDKKIRSAYTFKLATDLSKDEVKKAVEQEYKVTVTGVRVINRPGKSRRFKGISGRTSITRLAIVSVKSGDRIAAFEAEENKSENKK